MTPHHDRSPWEPEDRGMNPSDNESFVTVLQRATLRRRSFLKGGSSLIAASMVGMGLAVLGDTLKPDKIAARAATPEGLDLNFSPVAKTLTDQVTVPAGYTVNVLMATGDPLTNRVAPYKNDGTDTDFEFRSGDHHDGMHFFSLNPRNVNRGILCVNHEVCEDLGFVHANGPTDYGADNTNARPMAEIDKEVNAHGVSIVEVVKQGNSYAINKGSRYNRRVTAATPCDLTGPVRGHQKMVTSYSPQGVATRGTVNNCANGYTPWGTYLTCEENWWGYFARREGADVRPAQEEYALQRYGIKGDTSGRYNWARLGANDTTDVYARWNTAKTSDRPDRDFSNVANTFGWIVEIDPLEPDSRPQKRTAMGRFFHEGCWPAPAQAGRPVVFYSGDDARNEYVYKFVSAQMWSDRDQEGGLEAGAKYLNQGTLYAAKFNADGSGEWLPLTLDNPAIATYTNYTFADPADVLINSRIAADAVGATKMDRPEWGGVHPVNGEVYFTLTNSVSSSSGRGTKTPLDPANPRFYRDEKGDATNAGNVNGHIIRWREAGNDHAATAFTWDVYLFGAQADAGDEVNLSGLSAENDFSSPDGLWFSDAAPGLLWIQTDDSAYTDQSNCMMLAAIPGQVGDGGMKAIANKAVPANGGADQTVTTYAGQAANPTTLRRFLVGPKDCEITGITETPDGTAIFVNIQHPGENSTSATNPAEFTSHWPDGGSARPRSATIVITRNDGGRIAR
ncbi:PhoX family protein [Spirulina major]|uniref:PhoX family protein n=1 Tax=Spirulina major TaxID=270636 RepID=UPI000934057B|nr:PhoX family phosphatase [Spirulina major]